MFVKLLEVKTIINAEDPTLSDIHIRHCIVSHNTPNIQKTFTPWSPTALQLKKEDALNYVMALLDFNVNSKANNSIDSQKIKEASKELTSEEDSDLELQFSARGFAFVEFIDKYKSECSLQESSASGNVVDGSYIWFGVDKPFAEYKVEDGEQVRMHISQTQMEQLLPLLQRFVRTGQLRKEEE